MDTRLVVLCCFVAMAVITIHQSEGATITRVDKNKKKCKDRHIWIVDGSAPCSALVKQTYWALHIDPDKWCNKYYRLTDCCETCGKLRAQGLIY